MNPDIHQHIEAYEKNMAELKNLIYQGQAADVADMIEKQAAFFRTTST
jgi:prephenate dehydrogenase